MGPICGKPLSLSFNYRTGQLYIADSYLGLRVVGPCGGLATLLASSAENVAFQFLSCVEVDQLTGTVYFTDVSQFYDLRNHTEPGFFKDFSGRLLSYDPETRRASVLMKGIGAATGVAISANGNFLLVSENLTKRIHRFWLRGSRASTSEIFSTLPRNPYKIRRTASGDFWVAMATWNTEATPFEVFPLAQKFNSKGGVVA
ncbi:protein STRICTOSIDINE SYNTHASE-LIKE 10-like [Diospyros lotus]|uniref:protein STRICTOSIDINE SYNTHASE-LIKE 10-like n=1 Tax=Diospyros lotus TaxID=55363 RepID=UPI002259B6DE|nr:protein STRICTOSIDINE SYNTHASE-LIKE 10-like [Diospyros lotus]